MDMIAIECYDFDALNFGDFFIVEAFMLVIPIVRLVVRYLQC